MNDNNDYLGMTRVRRLWIEAEELLERITADMDEIEESLRQLQGSHVRLLRRRINQLRIISED